MTEVRRRCVLYVSGFDPKGAAHYHALFKKEGGAHSQRHGWQLDVGPRKRLDQGNAAWRLEARVDGAAVSTDYEFLSWDDIVRAHWTRAMPLLWWQILSTTWLNWRSGALGRMYRLSWPPVLALTLPFFLVLLLLLGTPAAGLLLMSMAKGMGADWPMAGLLGVAAAGAVWIAGRWLEGRYSMYWMMRSYVFNALQAQDKTPELDRRLQAHAHTLVERVGSGRYDEVLLVGHSSGATMAAIVLAKALRLNAELSQQATSLSLLTLGQWLPALGSLPMASAFQSDLQLIASAKGLNWIDFSAPPDGCCFALQDPLLACGVSPIPGGVALKVLNPKFADMFDPGEYHRLKKDKFKLHFQYIKATDRTVAYDYFLTVAGPLTLAERYRHQASVVAYAALRGRWWRSGA